MKNFKEKYGPWAIVTGASAGIGLEFANQLAELGLNLVLVARRKDRLQEISGRLTAEHKVKVVAVQADLEKENFLKEIQKSASKLEIGLLINNAGYALTGEFLSHTIETELGLLNLNCRAPLVLAHSYAGKMVKRGKGGMIFVSSIAAFLPMPLWTNYSASKAYDLHIANGLYYELKDKGVDVLTLCPGHTRTEFSEIAGIKNEGMDPKKVVSLALKKLGKRPHVVPGIENKFISFISRLTSRKRSIKIGAMAVKKMLE